MSILKKLFILGLSLGVTFTMIACDDEADCDGGACDDAAAGGGGEPTGGTEPAADYRYIMVIDESGDMDVNADGTPGVDICGIWAVCDGTDITAKISVTIDDENVCGQAGADPGVCTSGIDRNDPVAVTSDGSCDGDATTSGYVSLGISGDLTADFEQDLDGCTVHIVEADGGDAEGAQVYVCSDLSDMESCIDLNGFATDGSGDRTGTDHDFLISI